MNSLQIYKIVRMDELSLIVQSLIDSETDDMILDVVYEIHSSLKGIPEEQCDINNNGNKTKKFTNSIETKTCICPNCGQKNLAATRFAYHLAKCLGAGRQSSRQAQRRIIDQITLISASEEDLFDGDQLYKSEETTSISEDGCSCTDSTSSSMTLIPSSKIQCRISHEDQEYTNDFDNNSDEEEDDWKPRKKKRRIPTTNININGINNKNKKKKMKDVLVVMSPPNSELDLDTCIIPVNKFCPVTKHVMIPLVPLSVSSTTPSNGHQIFVKTPSVPSHCLVKSPFNLVEDDQSTIIIFEEDNK